MNKISDRDFFTKDVLELAPELVGKIISVNINNLVKEYRITQTEAYRGEEDLACHARKGRTKRTDPMYYEGGILYVYLVYGIHWMLNIVAGKKGSPQAALIRGIKNFEGPGKLTKEMKINKSFNYIDITKSNRIFLMDDNYKPEVITKPRIGIDYAGDYWKNKEWRFISS